MSTISPSEFMQVLDGVKVVRYDGERDMLFGWWGGHGIHGYTSAEGGEWQEVMYWQTGGGDLNATESEVQHSITDHLAMDAEEFWSFC